MADEAGIAEWAANDLGLNASVLAGGFEAWKKAGQAVEANDQVPADALCIDFLFFVHDRHDGNKEAARRYLAWETGLVQQLDAQELAEFQLPHASTDASDHAPASAS